MGLAIKYSKTFQNLSSFKFNNAQLHQSFGLFIVWIFLGISDLQVNFTEKGITEKFFIFILSIYIYKFGKQSARFGFQSLGHLEAKSIELYNEAGYTGLCEQRARDIFISYTVAYRLVPDCNIITEFLYYTDSNFSTKNITVILTFPANLRICNALCLYKIDHMFIQNSFCCIRSCA